LTPQLKHVAPVVEEAFPTIALWTRSWGWIEIGQNDTRRSMVRALDEGGMVWEGKVKYATLDELLQDLEAALSDWMNENA
jgi:hypothetical protein